MLKPSPLRIVFVLLSAFFVILVAAWFSGSTVKICNESQSGHEQCTTHNLAPFILIQIIEFLHSVENIITAVATIAIAVFTWTLYKSSEKMWSATKIAADAAAQSAEAQVAVEGARLTCLPTSSSYWNEIGQWADRWPNSPDMPLKKTFDVLFALKNYGKTPATIVGVNARLTRSAEAPSDIYIESPFLDLPAEIVVGAGLRSEGEFKVEFSQFFRLEEAIQVRDGKLNVWFNGRILYDDVFGRVGTQVFLYKVRPRGGFTPIWDQTTYRQK
jgi:hypothetical protein